MRYAGTAGGLLHTNSESASLLTPLAVVGDDVESVSRQLDALLTETAAGNIVEVYATGKLTKEAYASFVPMTEDAFVVESRDRSSRTRLDSSAGTINQPTRGAAEPEIPER